MTLCSTELLRQFNGKNSVGTIVYLHEIGLIQNLPSKWIIDINERAKTILLEENIMGYVKGF